MNPRFASLDAYKISLNGGNCTKNLEQENGGEIKYANTGCNIDFMLHQNLYPEHNLPRSPQLNHHSMMPLTLPPRFSRPSLSEKAANQYLFTNVRRAREASISHSDSPRAPSGPQPQRNEFIAIKQQKKLDQGLVEQKAVAKKGAEQGGTKHDLKLEKKNLPVELWEMIINEVNCISTLSSLSRVSRTLYYLATPSLYRNLGLVYKSSTEMGVINYVEAFLNDDALEKKCTPFTNSHRNHLRSVRSIVIVDARRDAPCSLTECARTTCIRCGAVRSPPNPQEVQNRCLLSEIFSEMPAPIKVAWVRGSSKLGVPVVLLEILQQRGSPKLETIQFDMSGWTTFPDKFDEFLGNIHHLKTLELTEISKSTILGSVGNFLQSPSGKSIRALRLEASPDMPGGARNLRRLRSNKTDTLDLQPGFLPEIESLHLKRIHANSINESVIASVVNPSTLTTLRLIECLFQATTLGQFPNLKVLHLSGGYRFDPYLFESLPVLEEFIFEVDVKVERDYSGGVTKYFRDKGLNLKRLGVTFTRKARPELISARLSRAFQERDLMEYIGSYCQNLEELGLWKANLQHAEKMITKLPKLRAISFNSKPESDVSSYPMTVSTAHSIFSLADSCYPLTPGVVNSSGQRSGLKYIKLNFDAWERLDPDEVGKPSDCIMPTMTIRTLSRKSAGQAIPQIFMIEELEQRQQFWGSAAKPLDFTAPVPMLKFRKPTLNSRYMRY